jgi:lysophospholipase L1-like esterase
MSTFETFPVGKGIVCFGDSITLMAAARADRGYPSILDEALFSRGVSVGNYGVGGSGYATSQSNYDLFHKSRGLWGACILVGVNDIAADTSAGATFVGINTLVQSMLTDGLRVVISTILPWKNGGGWTAPRQIATESVNASILGLTNTHPNLRVVDCYAALGSIDDPQLLRRDAQELIPDSLHLGSFGAQLFSDLVLGSWIDLIDVSALVPVVSQPEITIANWTEIENALQARIALGLRLPGDRVRWGDVSRDGHGTAGDYAILRVGNITSLAPATPEQSITNNPQAFPGGEILLNSLEPTEFELSITVYSMRTTGNHSAYARATSARSALHSESTTAALEAVNVAIVQCESVQSLPALLETEYQGKAVFTALIRISDGNTESVTYIESAEWVGTLT